MTLVFFFATSDHPTFATRIRKQLPHALCIQYIQLHSQANQKRTELFGYLVLLNTCILSHIQVRRLYIPPDHYMVFRVGILTKDEEGETKGSVFIETDFHSFDVHFRFRVARGSLHTVPRELIFDPVFPVSCTGRNLRPNLISCNYIHRYFSCTSIHYFNLFLDSFLDNFWYFTLFDIRRWLLKEYEVWKKLRVPKSVKYETVTRNLERLKQNENRYCPKILQYCPYSAIKLI